MFSLSKSTKFQSAKAQQRISNGGSRSLWAWIVYAYFVVRAFGWATRGNKRKKTFSRFFYAHKQRNTYRQNHFRHLEKRRTFYCVARPKSAYRPKQSIPPTQQSIIHQYRTALSNFGGIRYRLFPSLLYSFETEPKRWGVVNNATKRCKQSNSNLLITNQITPIFAAKI